ncbi:MAG: hypothetical protein H6741_15800 [Alphaproteobacteria bacterium]|nr:hypothetical protein [Alphaproteobacteria bacterium]
MQLDTKEISELAGFLAKRFPSAGQIGELARAVGVEPPDQGTPRERWGALLLGVQAQGGLLKLVRMASDMAPEDSNLTELRRTLEAEQAAGRRPMALAMVIALSLVIGVAAWAWTRPAAPPPAAPPRGPELTGDLLTKLDDAPAEAPTETERSQAPPAGEAEPAVEAEPVVEAVPEAAPETLAQAEAPPVAEPAPAARPPEPASEQSVSGRCAGPATEVIGYWYAGAPFTPQAGETYTLKYGVNVRADYPRRANDWDAKTRVVCSLLGGDELRLTHDPILVDGGRYWVPFTPADLRSR